jgi:hypothetical protein
MFKFYTLISVICSPLLEECVEINHSKKFKNLNDCLIAADQIVLEMSQVKKNDTMLFGLEIKNYCKEKKIWQA